jgi:hypothetical protein
MVTPLGAAGADGAEQLSVKTDVNCVSMSRTADWCCWRSCQSAEPSSEIKRLSFY